MNNRIFFFIAFIFFLILSLLMLLPSLITLTEPGSRLYPTIMLTVTSFSWWKLYPQFQKKDERMTYIQQKSLVYTFFFTAAYLVLVLINNQFTLIHLNTEDTISLLGSLIGSTAFINMLILAKKY
jgi:predicted ABC-type exoprotein transport system permease subunit